MRALISCLTILGTAALAAAGDLKVPQDFATIQAAVDASADGDVILVGPGVYAESVSAVKSNITIQGRGATWDGGSGGAAGPCLDLQGNGNVVAGFTFTGGTDQVTLVGSNVEVSHCASSDAQGSFLVIQGSGATVTSCQTTGDGGNAVVVEGDTCTLLHVRVATCDGTGIEVTGDGATMIGCRVQAAGDGGISVNGQDCTMVHCRVMASASFGFDLQVDASSITGNTAIACGSTGGAGFVISGSDNQIRLDHAVHCTSDGFSVQGDGNAMSRDSATNCQDDGIDIQGGLAITITGCVSVHNGQEGVENGGTGTEIQGCRLVANQTDIALDGSLDASFDQVVRTTFQTGSALTVVTGD